MTAGHECKDCNKWKPLEAFSLFKSKGYWYRRKDCRECVNAKSRARHHQRKDDPVYIEKKRETERRTYAKNRAKRRAESDRWYYANHERNKLRLRRNHLRRALIKQRREF